MTNTLNNISSDMVPYNKPLAYIQALRGIAALLVVMWHGSRFISPYGTGLGFLMFGSGGSMGVDLFFVISGFIMVYTTSRNDGSTSYCRNYFVKRLTRIWPTYVVLSLIYVMASHSGFDYFSDPKNVRLFIETLTFVPTNNAIGPPVFEYPALAVGWTLNYEMYFYLIFGVSLLFGRLRWYAFFGYVVLCLIVLPLIGGSLSLDTTKDSGYGIAYINLITNPIIWLFVAGVVIGLVYKTNLKINNVYYARLAILISLTCLIWQYCSGFRVYHGILGSGLFIIPFVLLLSLSSKTIDIKLPLSVIFLGDISFSLYLLHPLVQERLVAQFNSVGLNSYASGFAFLFLTTMLSIAIASISYLYIERGLSEWVKNQCKKSE